MESKAYIRICETCWNQFSQLGLQICWICLEKDTNWNENIVSQPCLFRPPIVLKTKLGMIVLPILKFESVIHQISKHREKYTSLIRFLKSNIGLIQKIVILVYLGLIQVKASSIKNDNVTSMWIWYH